MRVSMCWMNQIGLSSCFSSNSCVGFPWAWWFCCWARYSCFEEFWSQKGNRAMIASIAYSHLRLVWVFRFLQSFGLACFFALSARTPEVLFLAWVFDTWLLYLWWSALIGFRITVKVLSFAMLFFRVFWFARRVSDCHLGVFRFQFLLCDLARIWVFRFLLRVIKWFLLSLHRVFLHFTLISSWVL